MKRVQLLTITEIDVPAKEGDDPEEQAQQRLDAFRESVLPSSDYGICIYRATKEDLLKFLDTNLTNLCYTCPVITFTPKDEEEEDDDED